MKSYLMLLLSLMSASCAPTVGPIPTQVSPESAKKPTPIVKDGVQVSVEMEPSSFTADTNPKFKVRFTNVGQQPRNLYDVTAYWKWRIDLNCTDAEAAVPGPWRLRMNEIRRWVEIDSREIKPGQSTDVIVDLNDPPFTFDYSYKRSIPKSVNPSRRLNPGQYQMTVVLALPNPPRDAANQWTGPVTLEPVAFTVTTAAPGPHTKEELVACDAAVARVTDKLGGMWMNGMMPDVGLANDADHEDVIARVVNYSDGKKAYTVLRTVPFIETGFSPGFAALLRFGSSYKVLVSVPTGKFNWWGRLYDTELVLPEPAREPM